VKSTSLFWKEMVVVSVSVHQVAGYDVLIFKTLSSKPQLIELKANPGFSCERTNRKPNPQI